MSNRIAVIVPCTDRKKITPKLDLSFRSLGKQKVSDLAQEWMRRFDGVPRVIARELYCGEGWTRAISAYEKARELAANTTLFVISAGMGLINAETMIPSYSATFAAKGEDQISNHILGHASKSASMNREWWHAINSMNDCYENNLNAIMDHDLVFMAVGAAYYRVMSDEIDILGSRLGKDRLYIIAVGLSNQSDDSPYILPIDMSFEVLVPGARASINQRALDWLFHNVLPYEMVKRGLLVERINTLMAPVRGRRIQRKVLKASDDVVTDWIRVRLAPDSSQTKLLREFRREHSCEQSRFRRIFLSVRDNWSKRDDQ